MQNFIKEQNIQTCFIWCWWWGANEECFDRKAFWGAWKPDVSICRWQVFKSPPESAYVNRRNFLSALSSSPGLRNQKSISLPSRNYFFTTPSPNSRIGAIRPNPEVFCETIRTNVPAEKDYAGTSFPLLERIFDEHLLRLYEWLLAIRKLLRI